MFGSLGFPEILFILVLALLVFGPRKLPEVGRTIGRALGEFRRATGDLKRSFDQEMNSEATVPERRTEATKKAAGKSGDDVADGSETATEESSDGGEPAEADAREAAAADSGEAVDKSE